MSRLVAAALLVLVAGCSGDPVEPKPAATPTPTFVYPGKTWAEAKAGDFKQLDGELANGRSTCVAVIKDGELVTFSSFTEGVLKALRTP